MRGRNTSGRAYHPVLQQYRIIRSYVTEEPSSTHTTPATPGYTASMMKKANTAVVLHSEYWPHEQDLAFRKNNSAGTGESVCKDCGAYGKKHTQQQQQNEHRLVRSLNSLTSLIEIDFGGSKVTCRVDKRTTRLCLPVT